MDLELSKASISSEKIEDMILMLRGEKVIIDADLAVLYGVMTKRLNEQVKRNRKRFPEDFMFKLTTEEAFELVANCDRFKKMKHSSSLPYAFTEHGAIMLANVLNNENAIEVSVYVVRAFVKMRRVLCEYKELESKLEKLDRQVSGHDTQIQSLVSAIRQLVLPTEKSSKVRKIGF